MNTTTRTTATFAVVLLSLGLSEAPVAALEPKCGEEIGSGCWKELTNEPGCYVWVNAPLPDWPKFLQLDWIILQPDWDKFFLSDYPDRAYPDQTITWSGQCSNGFAIGGGELIRKAETWEVRYSSMAGEMRGGKQHGHWVFHYGDGTVAEGSLVDGKQYGRWVVDTAYGASLEGTIKNDGQHGHWVISDAYGTIEEGTIVDGKRHGQWVSRHTDGRIGIGPYVDGKEHGQWVRRSADLGIVEEGPYVDGKKHGQWIYNHVDEWIAYEGPYVDDEKHGQWIYRYGDGTCSKLEYSVGELISEESEEPC